MVHSIFLSKFILGVLLPFLYPPMERENEIGEREREGKRDL